MALDQTIDSAVEEFNENLIIAQNLFIDDIEALQDEGLSTEEILIVLAGISMVDYWLQDLKMQKAINRLMISFDTLLDDATFFGAVTETKLLALRNMQESSLIRYVTDIGDKIRLSLSQGVLQNMSKRDLQDMLLRDLSIKPYQAKTIVETSMANYSRSLTLLQLESSPNQKLIYSGPLDSKTRPVCIRMLKEPGLTQEQIEAKYPGALRDGGGFNCRHQFVPLSSKTQNKDVRQRAQVAYQGMINKARKKGRTFKPPITLEQYYDRSE